jgi:2-hydroxychromene-2-carboxylate isomerase
VTGAAGVRGRAAATRFYFDLGCPFSYLAAERIERVLGEVQWVPAAGIGERDAAAVRAHAETCAVALRLPLVWPDRLAPAISGASRAAVYAAEIGAGARFALATSRLAFCGGFDLDDPETLAEAAAAAGIPLRACLAAAGDASRDAQLLAAGQGLTNRGVHRLPAIRVGRRIFQGDRLLAEAAALLRSQATYARPLAPAG